MRTASLLLASAVCLAAQVNPLGHTAEVVGEGKKLYNTSCTMCHGMDGTVGDRAPALAAKRKYLRSSNGQLFDAIKKGIPGTAMPPVPLPDPDVWKVVAYIRSLRATASDEFVEGDTARGEAIFTGKGECLRCHMIRGKGGLIGPDLSNAGGERSLRALRESLTDPQTPVTKGYHPVRLVTVDGQKVEGVIRNEDSFSLQVMDLNYNLHLLLRKDLKTIDYPEKSLMPRNYDQQLSKDELQDLLAYLSRQSTGARRSR